MRKTNSEHSHLIFWLVNIWAYCRHPFLVARFFWALKYLPSIALPDTYNEKILWRKIFDHNPLIGALSDKLWAKQYFQEHCTGIQTAEVLWSGERASDIPIKVLQGKVVVKTNHGSGFNYFVQGKDIDRKSLDKQVQRWLQHHPYGRKSGEWGYRKVQPRVYVERMLSTSQQAEPVQLNFSTFAGRPVIALVITGAVYGPKQAGIFGADGDRLAGTPHHFLQEEQQLPSDYQLPGCFEKAVDYASVLGKKLDYARIDFLALGDELFASEITFYTLGGLATYTDPGIDRLLSDAWNLRQSWFLQTLNSGWRKVYAQCLNEYLAKNQPSK